MLWEKEEYEPACCPSSPASPVFGTWKDAHLLPFTVLVQHDDHQPGMHLVAFLSEGQVFAIPRHIDHKSGERKRERQMFREKSKENLIIKHILKKDCQSEDDLINNGNLDKQVLHNPILAVYTQARLLSFLYLANIYETCAVGFVLDAKITKI